VNKKSKRKRKEKAKMVIAIVSTVFGSAPWTILSQNIRSAYDAAVEPPWSYPDCFKVQVLPAHGAAPAQKIHQVVR
jgi:hypothetical protein